MASSVSLLQLQLDSLPAAAADATTAATTAAAVAAAAASHGSDARRRTTSTGTGIRTVRRRLLVNSCYLRVSCHNSTCIISSLKNIVAKHFKCRGWRGRPMK